MWDDHLIETIKDYHMLGNAGFQLDRQEPPKTLLTSQFALSFSRLVTSECIVAHHPINNGIMGMGKPIDGEFALSMVQELIEGKQVELWRDPRVVYESTAILVWYRPPSKKAESMWFSVHGDPTFDVKVKIPGLIFIRSKHNSATNIFAFAGNRKPDPKTRLYAAPLCNTNELGSFCLGSASVPVGEPEIAKMIAGTEDGVLKNSAFSHVSNGNTFSELHGKESYSTRDHIKIWKKFAKNEDMPRAKDMCKLNITLADAVMRLEK